MKRPYVFIAALAAALGLSGCDALINQQNFFANFEPNLTDNYSASTTGDELLNALSSDTESSSFYTDLADNPTVLEAIKVNLTDLITNGTDAQKEEAAIYYSDIVLNTTEVGDVVNNLVGSLFNNNSNAADPAAATIDSMLSPIDSMLSNPSDPTSFETFMSDVQSLASTYSTLASVVTTDSLSPDLAQAAIVILALDTVVNAIDLTNPNTSGDPVTDLFNYLADLQDGTIDNSANELVLTSGFDIQTALLGDPAVTDDSDIDILLNAAGLGSLTDLISSMGN